MPIRDHEISNQRMTRASKCISFEPLIIKVGIETYINVKLMDQSLFELENTVARYVSLIINRIWLGSSGDGGGGGGDVGVQSARVGWMGGAI